MPYWFRTNTINYAKTSVPGYVASDGQLGSNTSTYGITAHNSPSCVYISRHDVTGDKSYDDFLTQELSQPLSAGHTYHVEFWTLRFGSSQFHTKLAISITSSSNAPVYDLAQNSLIPSPGNKVLVSPDIQKYNTWVKVAGDIFIPGNDTGNKWLTIGNDRSDQTYDSNLPDNGQNGILFFVDDVSLVDLGICPLPLVPQLALTYHDNCKLTANYQITNYDPNLIYALTHDDGLAPITSLTGANLFCKGRPDLELGTFTITVTNSCGASSSFEGGVWFSDCPSSERVAANAIPSHDQSAVVAYPNPATESLTAPADVEGATLLNSAGKPVQKADASGKLDVQSPPDGLYNLQMMRNGKLINQRIQVKH